MASNMQFSLISRRMIEGLSLNGPFFRSPFPDFYATPLLFLRSERILVCSRPMVIVGITPKSYGAFHFSNRPSEGVSFLQNERQLREASSVQLIMLPGTSYNDSWLLAMEALCANCGGRSGVRPNYRRYRFLQIVHGYKSRYFDRKLPAYRLFSTSGQDESTREDTLWIRAVAVLQHAAADASPWTRGHRRNAAAAPRSAHYSQRVVRCPPV